MTDNPNGWYTIAYLDGYLSFYKADLIKEIADQIFRENPILKALREQPRRKHYHQRGKGWQ